MIPITSFIGPYHALFFKKNSDYDVESFNIFFAVDDYRRYELKNLPCNNHEEEMVSSEAVHCLFFI